MSRLQCCNPGGQGFDGLLQIRNQRPQVSPVCCACACRSISACRVASSSTLSGSLRFPFLELESELSYGSRPGDLDGQIPEEHPGFEVYEVVAGFQHLVHHPVPRSVTIRMRTLPSVMKANHFWPFFRRVLNPPCSRPLFQ